MFVTGHTGFKGSWLAIWLDRLGARVTGYALAAADRAEQLRRQRRRASCWPARRGRHPRRRPADAGRWPRPIPTSFSTWPPSRWCGTATPQPRETFEVNVMGTAACWMRCGPAASRAPWSSSPATSATRTASRSGATARSIRWAATIPYSASKGAAEIVAAAYRRSFFPPAAARRARREAGHGPGRQRHRRRRLGQGPHRAGRRAAAWPPASRCRCAIPGAVRPWQHVLEPLGGYLTLAARMLQSDDPAWCDAWNFGPHAGRGDCPSAAWWSCSSRPGAAAAGRTRAIRASRTRPTCCG